MAWLRVSTVSLSHGSKKSMWITCHGIFHVCCTCMGGFRFSSVELYSHVVVTPDMVGYLISNIRYATYTGHIACHTHARHLNKLGYLMVISVVNLISTTVFFTSQCDMYNQSNPLLMVRACQTMIIGILAKKNHSAWQVYSISPQKWTIAFTILSIITRIKLWISSTTFGRINLFM